MRIGLYARPAHHFERRTIDAALASQGQFLFQVRTLHDGRYIIIVGVNKQMKKGYVKMTHENNGSLENY